MDQLWDRTGYGTLISTGAGDSFVHSPAGGVLRDGDSWLHGDAVGSVRYSTDPTGAVNGSAAFTVFGEPRTAGNSQFGFAGEQTDPTGVIHLRARGYNPALGTFTAYDPIQPGGPSTAGWNHYTYAANNPTTWTDPSGRATTAGYAAGIVLLGAIGVAAIYFALNPGDFDLGGSTARPAGSGRDSTETHDSISEEVAEGTRPGNSGAQTGGTAPPIEDLSQADYDQLFWDIVEESLQPNQDPDPEPSVVPVPPDSFGHDCDTVPLPENQRGELARIAQELNLSRVEDLYWMQTVAALGICIDTAAGPIGAAVVAGQPQLEEPSQTDRLALMSRVVGAPNLADYSHAEGKTVEFAKRIPGAQMDAIYTTNQFCAACQTYLRGQGFAVNNMDLHYAVHSR